MASINQLRRGLDILAKYCDPDDPCGCCAEHDEIFSGHDASKVSAEDKKALKELGWTFDSGIGSWHHFT